MNKIILMTLSLLTVIGFSATEIEVETEETVQYNMAKPPGTPSDCPDEGSGCTITKTRKVKKKLVHVAQHPTSTGYLITFTDDNKTLSLDDTPNPPIEYTPRNLSWAYDSNSQIKIIYSDEYPTLNGKIINLNGYSADVNGQVTIWYIPAS